MHGYYGINPGMFKLMTVLMQATSIICTTHHIAMLDLIATVGS